MSVQTFSLKIHGEQPVSKNIKVKECKCKDGSDTILCDVPFVQNFVQPIRDHFNKPIIVMSAFRTPEYNKKVGGTNNSYHMQGRAFDIRIDGVAPIEIARHAEKLGIKGIILYDTGFVHIDSRNGITEKKYWAKKIKDTYIPVSTFQG